jgi:hypothetical protein
MEEGPPRHQTGQEIIEELNNLKISDGGEEFEGYEKEHNYMSNRQPTHKQLDNMRRSGIQGRPKFCDTLIFIKEQNSRI